MHRNVKKAIQLQINLERVKNLLIEWKDMDMF